jgi:hypothetical protein
MGQEVTMEASTAAQTDAGASEKDPRFAAAKRAGQGEPGREMLEHAAQGAELDQAEEASALDWLLGTPKPISHKIPVDLETESGMRKLTFISQRIDPRKIDAIEIRNVQQSTGRIDRITADCEIIAESCTELDDGRRKVKLNSDEFMTVRLRNRDTDQVEPVKLASPATALEKRFVGQEGLLTLVAAEIRRLGGYDPQRLGTSQRRLVEASLG